ncbi:hypothetical protein AX27061_1191 [Achromobacter xylosoxidans NBRC 15126 = ATCC 27061]|nr:hypothetical protein AX27061_1191 [Achromobacter xylosoxidans NBRC 15126 = ATCC 27061]
MYETALVGQQSTGQFAARALCRPGFARRHHITSPFYGKKKPPPHKGGEAENLPASCFCRFFRKPLELTASGNGAWPKRTRPRYCPGQAVALPVRKSPPSFR